VSPKQVARRQSAQTPRSQRKAKSPVGSFNGFWRLPSGKRLAEFALASGFLAPPLMNDRRERSAAEKKV
jgi:hypothetical protein